VSAPSCLNRPGLLHNQNTDLLTPLLIPSFSIEQCRKSCDPSTLVCTFVPPELKDLDEDELNPFASFEFSLHCSEETKVPYPDVHPSFALAASTWFVKKLRLRCRLRSRLVPRSQSIRLLSGDEGARRKGDRQQDRKGDLDCRSVPLNATNIPSRTESHLMLRSSVCGP
jgi:hypothetical protein